ncbi:ATP-binding protein [Candidatus Sumerlaeota bacterium]|nr:ATP-binding protein [Candidatus Sumerlaeota bacterium]
MISERRNIPIYVANIVFLFFGLAVLIWLKTRFDKDLNTAIDTTRGLFSREEVLKSPDDVRIRFSQIEHLARQNKNIYIKDMVVSKILISGDEVAVYPFYLSATTPDWKQRLLSKGWRRILLTSNGIPYGAIYLQLNYALLNGIKFAILSFALLLIVSLVVLLLRLYRQEEVITATTIALNEKNQELMRLERLALAGQLTANIFHDIKKPILNLKHAFADILERKQEMSPSEIKQNVENMNQQVGLFFSILNELGIERFVRASNEENEFVDLNDLVERSCNLVRYEQRHIKVVKELADNLPAIFVNPYKLIQLFSNIILNAYQAMEGKGELRIRTSRNNDNLVVEITDTGPGIKPEHLRYLFTPFFSTKDSSEAAGLGLYICKNIVDELGGEISVDSVVGKGTTFRIQLPPPQQLKPSKATTKQ